MAQGLERIPLDIDSITKYPDVQYNFPDQTKPEIKIVSFEPDQQQAAPVQSDIGIGDTMATLGRNVWDAVVYHTPAAVAAAVEGDEPYKTWDWKDALIERSRKRSQEVSGINDSKTGTAIPGVSKQDINSLGPSLGFSITGAGAGLGAGIPAGIAGNMIAPVAGTAAGYTAGMAASGKAAYNMATNQFVRDLYDSVNQESVKATGKPITPEQFSAKQAELSDVIRSYGLWEAVPEAAGNALSFGVLTAPVKGAIGKLFGKNVATRFASKLGTLYGGELSTETITQMGQHNAEVDAGMSNEPRREFTSGSDWVDSLNEIAPATILQTTLMAGGFKAGQMAKDRILGKKDDGKDDPVPAADIGAGPADGGGLSGEFIPADPRSQLPPPGPGAGSTYDQRQPGQAMLPAPDTLSGDVLGPETLPPGQRLLDQPAIDGESSMGAGEFARPALPSTPPTERQSATARGLLNHSPKASPDLLMRLMRVDHDTANQLFNHWQGAKNERESSARIAQAPAVFDMAQHEGSLPQPEQSILPQLRREGSSGLPGMAGQLPGVPSISGGEAEQPSLAGQDQQQRQLRAGERPLADQEGTGAQHAQESPFDAQRNNEASDGMGGGDRGGSVNVAVQNQPGRNDDGGGIDNAEATNGKTQTASFEPRKDGAIAVRGFTREEYRAAKKALGLGNVYTDENGSALFPAPSKGVTPAAHLKSIKKALGYKDVSTPAKRAKPRSDELLQAIINRGGISRSIMSDVGADKGARYRPGLFTNSGTEDLSELATLLFNEDEFHVIDQNSDIGPARELEDLIGRALGGERILNTGAMEREHIDELSAKKRAEIERLANEYGVALKEGTRKRSDEDVEEELERAISFELEKAGETYGSIRNSAIAEGVTEGELDTIETPIAVSYDGDKRRDHMILMYRDLANAIQEKIDGHQQQVLQSGNGVRREEGAGTRPDAGVSEAAPRVEGATGEEQSKRPSLELAGETEAELAARDKATKDAEAQRLKDEQAADNKRQADAERDTFSLTGSDRPADTMAAQGQGGLFDAPAKPAPVEQKAEPKEEPKAEQKTDAKGNPIYKVGERVEYVDGQYKGRHGEISRVSPITMRTVMLFSGEQGTSETTYYYHVKTDNGADFMANPEEIKAETAKPESVVQDIEIDGAPQEPGYVLRSISYAKQSADKSRAAAQRARKADMIASHKQSAQVADEKAARYQAAWDSWAAKYPGEAEKLAPKKAAAPVSAAANSGDAIKAAGLTVTKTTTKNGKPVWEVGGNTREHSEMLKRIGGRWYGPKKVWSFYNDDPTASITAKLPAPSPTIAGKPTIEMSDKALEQIAASNQPAAEKAKAELAAREQADDVDLGQMFDEVLAEETAGSMGTIKNGKLFGGMEESESWWKSLTPNGRRMALDAVGSTAIKKEVLWGYLPAKVQKDLTAIIGTAKDPIVADGKVGAGETASSGPYSTWRDAYPSKRRELLRIAGYTDADQARALSGTDWNQLTDPVRRALSGHRTAGQAAASAVKNTGKGLADAIDGLGKLFGSNGSRLSSGLTFDEDTYKKAKPLFAQAIAHFKDAGQDLKEAMRAVVRLVLDKFGPQVAENMKPYVVRFMEDVKAGNMDYDESKENDNAESENLPQRERPETRDGQADRSDGGTRQPDRGSVGERVPEGDAQAGSRGTAAGSDQGSGQPGASRQGVRGEESMGGRDRESATAGDRPKRTATGLDADTPKTPSTEGVSVSGKADFQITEEDAIGEGGQKTKARNNIAAIRLLRKLEAEDRKATPAEQKILAKYVGWGGIKGIFDDAKAEWSKDRQDLKSLLSDEEYASARRSMLAAHYTSTDVVSGMWSAAQHLGFKGGRVLEPSVGVGNFFGMMPADLRAKSQLFGVELDKITALLARNLYPSATVANSGFQDVELPAGSFDFVIGNPPFGKDTLFDKNHPDLRTFSIHNFFFAKALDKLRPGGVMQMVVSHHLMDAIDSTARDYLAARADLIGAIRLPDTAFRANAGTDVVTDIIFLQKREADAPRAGADWSGTANIATTHPKTGERFDFHINRYFIDHPEMVVGEHLPTGKMNQAPNQYNVQIKAGESLFSTLGKVVANLPRDVMKPATKPLAEIAAADAIVPDGTKVYGYYMAGGKVMQRLPDSLDKRQGQPVAFTNEMAPARAEGMIGIRNALRDLMQSELSDAPASELDFKRAKLNKLYDAFQKKYGYINQPANRRAFRDDPDLPLLESLEPGFDAGLGKEAATKRGEEARKPSAKKVDIFSKRVLAPYQEVTSAASAKDALVASLNERGEIDPDHMATIYGKSWEEIRTELGDLIFHNPNGGWETSDAYLSGNVKAKLKLAEAAMETDPQYQANVEALRAVIPADVPALKISVRLGSSWVPPEVMAKFAEDLWGDTKAAIRYIKQVAKWSVMSDGGDSVARSSTWGVTYTTRSGRSSTFGADKILEHVANNRSIVIKENVGSSDQPVWKTNEPATEAIRAKAQEMASKFKEWIWQDEGRRTSLAAIYNEKYNTDRRRTYDGSHLTLPGSSPLIKLRKHQLAAIWRAIQDRVILLDHVVGAGKTYEKVAIAMELRRLGITRKPMFVVPNSLVRQWRDEFYKLYPNANVLAATEADFTKQNRKRFMAKIATGDWDAVIVAHSSFKKIGMPSETEWKILKEQLDDMSDAIEDLKRERGDKNVVRDMERIKIKLEERMKALRESGGKKDDTVTFDELGVDGVLVDEAHLFKNLFYYSQMRNVTGLGNPSGSGRAFDLFVKIQYLMQRYAGKALTAFATGTPVSNSLVEMFTMQRYLAWNKLKENGLHLLDAWAGVYGDVQQVYEVHPSGTGYRLSTRFAKFVNLPSLMELYRSFADVVTMDDLKDQAKADGGVFPVPKIKGGKPRNIVADRSEQQQRFFGVPEFGRTEDGGIKFKYPADLKVKQSDKDGKWYPWLPGGSKVGQEGFDTEAEAVAERDTLVRLPEVGWNSGSILHKFENLKELTKSSKGKINALSITNEARKAGLDYRLIDPMAPDFEGSKINLAIAEIKRIHKAWTKDRGAQLVFCDLSVPKSARAAAASKERTAYVRAGDGSLVEVKATVVTIEGVDASFLAIKRGKGDAAAVDLFEGLTGAPLTISKHTKAEAVAELKARIDADGLGWLEDLQDRYGEITDADVADFKDAQGKEEEAGEEGDDGAISVGELLALAGGNRFSVYDDIKAKLLKSGIPESEVAFIHDYDTAAKKNDLFKKVRAGEIRILLGSTEKMGAGMNVQERLVALHHLDAPWRPSDIEQREGRIVRQGNALYKRDPDGFEVELMRYGTRQTYDTRMWQIIEHKAAGVEQLRKAGDDLLEIDDVGGEAANAADMKAAASGNPLILDEIKLRNEVKSLEAQQFAYIQAKANLQDKVRWYRGAPARAESYVAEIQPFIDAAKSNPAKPFAFVTNDGKTIDDIKETAGPLTETFVYVAKGQLGEQGAAGKYRGMTIKFRKTMSGISVYGEAGSVKPTVLTSYGIEDKFSPSGMFQRLDNTLDKIADAATAERQRAERETSQIPKLEDEIAKPFAREEALKETRAKHRAVVSKLQKSGGGIELTPDMKGELDRAIAQRGGKKGMESRSATAGGIQSVKAIQDVVARFKAKFKGTAELDIRVVGSAAEIPASFRPSQYAEGVFHDDAGLIYLVAGNLLANGKADTGRAFQVLMHEAVGHFGLSRMMGDRFKPILAKVMGAAKAKGKVGPDIYEPGHKDYATVEAVRLRYPEATDEEIAQEVLARMAETEPGRTLFGYVRAVVRQWLRDMARAFGVALDVTTAELSDLVAMASAYMRRGDNLAGEFEPTGMAAASEKVGAGKTAFKPVDTNTPEFKQWFGASKVVDVDGKPLRVYHGTFGDFGEFKKKGVKARFTSPQKHLGYFFTSRTDYASEYADSGWAEREGNNVMPVYLSLQNPRYEDISKIAEIEDGWKQGEAKAYRQMLEGDGHDGIIFRGKIPRLGFVEEIVVFSPIQIKSAISNTGEFSDTNPDIRESRRGMESRAAAGARRQPGESSRGILDTILRKAGGELAAKITGPAYDKLTSFLGGKIPDGIKAGVVSDYGLDEGYIDRRTEMQTETQKGARKTKTFVEGLMDLDRAQSRIAYQWLNNRGEEADRLMAQLPPESRKVLEEIKQQIKKLTVEAVRLGQLDAETAARNWGTYLHRSYEKYDLKTDDKTWKAERAKAIKILGDQYKGRGLKMEIDPDRIHSAKGWWEGEMKGKKVKVFKSEAGRYAFVAVGTATPAELSSYKLEGTWEIRSAKTPSKLVLWRDFTAEERHMMGELDEAKYAVARTLFMMQRDIEVGRFHEWVADQYAKMPEEAEEEGLTMADASESMVRSFTPDEWVTVPAVKVPGTGVFKFGALAGMVVPGPVWNDIRQIGAGRYEPFGSAYASILRAWKLSKTALTPTTHVNNIMGNFVMADMHDVGARDISQAVRLMLAAAKGDNEAKALWDRFEDSGATQGMFTTHELKKEVLDPLLQALREEVGMADGEPAILKASAIMSLAFHGQIREAASAASAAIKQSVVGRGTSTVLNKAQDYYQNEDAVFRFAAFIKGIEDGKTDIESGKLARKAFLDYHINAPWINAMRGTAMPFIAFAYRAVPMLAETAAKKPWKIAKYMIVAGGLNALAYAMLGADGDEDKERAYLPEEKAGKLWGIVPKLIRMPWNRESTYRDGRKSIDPVFLDVRRWIPVGDIVDYGQDKTALPLIPQPLIPGGPLVMVGEFLVNKSAFTGKALTKETDTWIESAAKVGSHFYKGFAPNIPLPHSGTWAGTKIDNAIKGKEDPLGRVYPVPEAIASGFGVKLERYPIDLMKHNAALDMKMDMRELDDERRRLGRDYGRKGMERIELEEKVATIAEKKRKLAEEFKAKEARSK